MPRTLVATEALAQHPEWRVFDCRHDLVKTAIGAEEYAAGHIPGAIFVNLDRDLSAAKTGTNGRHPLPDAATFIAFLGKLGLNPQDQVVCYDASGGTYASRMWWMLRWVGHMEAAVLDGGYQKWVKEGHPTTTDIPRFPATNYPGKADDTLRVDAAYLEKNLGKPGMTVLDARNAQRFAGQNETIDPVAGHIPGALNRFHSENHAPDGTFKPVEALRSEFSTLLGATPPSQVVQQCGSGVSACVNMLAMEHAGFTGSKLYPGSWSEWCADPRRPMVKL